MGNNTNEFINDMNNPRDPEKSPVKKKSKKDALNSLFTPKQKAAKPAPASSNTSNTTNKRKKDETIDLTAADSSWKEVAAKNTGSKVKVTPQPKPAKQPTSIFKKPHVWTHSRVVVDASLDLAAPALAHYDKDNCKKTVHALKDLIKNLALADKHAALCHKDATETTHIGGSAGIPVPDNMTALGNFLGNLNQKQFGNRQTQPGGDGDEDALSGIKGGGQKKNNGRFAYFSVFLSCDKDPRELVSQVSFEWTNFGSFIRVKELQEMHTETPVVCYFLFSMVPKRIIQAEWEQCLTTIRDRMHADDLFIEGGHPFSWGTEAVPASSFRLNVPFIPGTKTQGISKMPRHLQNCRRHFHPEVASKDAEKVRVLIAQGKRWGIFKEKWGAHAHPTEVCTFDTISTDITRTLGTMRGSTNYNASLTCAEVHGFGDLDSRISIRDSEGNTIQRCSGRICLTTLLKLDDGSSAIAEVHQAIPGDVVYLVFPNIPEAEHIVNQLVRHAGGFMLNYLRDGNVDELFVQEFLRRFMDPAMVHEAHQCTWDSETMSIKAPGEEAEEEAAQELQNQSWFKDLVGQYEQLSTNDKAKKSRNYANAAALYDLDAEKSIKTVHKANDGVNNAVEIEEDVSTLGEEEATKRGGAGEMEEDEDSSQEELEEEVDSANLRSGDTPKSGRVQFHDDNMNDAEEETNDPSLSQQSAGDSAPASDAGSSEQDEAGRGG